MNCGTTSMIASINKIGNFEEVRDHMSRGKVIPYIIMFKIEDEEDNNVNEFTDKEELEDFETDRNEWKSEVEVSVPFTMEEQEK